MIISTDKIEDMLNTFRKSEFMTGWTDTFSPGEQYCSPAPKPRLDDEGSRIFELIMPGIKKTDVALRITDVDTIDNRRLLVVRGNRPDPADKEKTIKYGCDIRIPDNTDEQNIEAKLEDGILTVTLPRNRPTKSKIIVVT